MIEATKDAPTIAMRYFPRRTPDWVNQLEQSDVLFGRGSGTNKHPGNIVFREHIKKRKAEYNAAKHRRVKAKIAQEVVDSVLASNNEGPPPRFLRKATARDVSLSGVPDGAWCLVDDKTIVEKTKQALRHEATDFKDAQNDSSGGDQGPTADSHFNVPATQPDGHEVMACPQEVNQPVSEGGGLIIPLPLLPDSWHDSHSDPQGHSRGGQEDLADFQADASSTRLQEAGAPHKFTHHSMTDEEDPLMHLQDIYRDGRPSAMEASNEDDRLQVDSNIFHS